MVTPNWIFRYVRTGPGFSDERMRSGPDGVWPFSVSTDETAANPVRTLQRPHARFVKPMIASISRNRNHEQNVKPGPPRPGVSNLARQEQFPNRKF